MSFDSKMVLRSVREFSNASDDLANSVFQTADANLGRFFHLANTDPIIKHLVEPLLQLKINGVDLPDGRGGIDLPAGQQERLAYILQLLKGCVGREFGLISLAHSCFHDRLHDAALAKLFSQLVVPLLRDLKHRLSDLLEDAVVGQEQVNISSLSLFPLGRSTATGVEISALVKD